MNNTKTLLTITALLAAALAATAQVPKTPQDLDRMLALDRQTRVDAPERLLAREVKGETSPWTLVRLVSHLERVGQHAEKRRILRELTTRPEPYSSWAKGRLAAANPQPDRPPAMSSYLAKMVRDLDRDPKQRGAAVRELKRLGALALPEILRQLPKFGPVGMREGLDLVMPHVDGQVLAVLRRMLESKDPIVQTLAASVVPRLRGEERIELGRLALACQAKAAQMHGVQALLDAGVERERCLAAIGAVRNASSSTLRQQALASMGHQALRGFAQIDTWLEAAIRAGGRHSLSALTVWMGRRKSTESRRRVAMFQTLSKKLAGQMIWYEFDKPISQQDHDLVLEGLVIQDVAHEVLAKVPAEVVVRDLPRLLRLLRDAPQGSPGPRGSAMVQLLQTIYPRRVAGIEAAIKKLLDSPNSKVRSQAFRIIADLSPYWVLDQHQRFLSQESASQLAKVARRFARPKDMAWMLVAMRQEHFPSTVGIFLRLGSVLAERSDAANLTTALDMLVVGARRRDRYNLEHHAIVALERWFGPEHVTPTLRRLHEFDDRHTRLLAKLIQRHAKASDVPAIVAALERLVHRGVQPYLVDGVRRDGAGATLVHTLGPLGGAGTSYLKTLLNHQVLGSHALEGMVKAKGFDRSKLYLELLELPAEPSDDWIRIASAVLDDEWTAKHATTRAKALELVKNWPSQYNTENWILRSVPKAEGLATAVAVVERIGTDRAPNAESARAALRFLGSFRQEALIGTIALALQSSDHKVRREAVEQLGRTLSKLVAPHLIDALGDDDFSVRQQAETHLKTISSILSKKKQFRRDFKDLDK